MNPLIAVAHGTRSAVGQAQIRALVDAVAMCRPELDVRLAYVDVQHPRIGEVLPLRAQSGGVLPLRAQSGGVLPLRAQSGDMLPIRAQSKGAAPVIVPLLLSTGHHVRVDIAEAAGDCVVTPPLGPDPLLTEILAGSAGRDHDALVLAAAGSSDPGWLAEIAGVAADLNAHVAYASRDETKDVVAGLREQGAERITVAAYLLAEGLFYRSLHRAGADHVTPPLCHDPRVAGLVARRYDQATVPVRA
ncbi:CbiX/SirB N-terminal domain-containing protein [Actinoplanes sp. NPDC089786]|uniref:sirohydrochlorin chelatase n=1 Tax=Actinoplanes sp. NPDC089786 TaxID=3155185 RepID=UPI00341B0FFB